MSGSIFTTFDINRARVHWEDSLLKLTPWEEHEGVWFKREDYFAPLGYGGPNGSKMRQLIHLFDRHRGNATHVMTAASVLSPQHSMTAVLCRHYELPGLHIIGATTPEKAVRHVNIAIAAGFGAQFEAVPVAFNPALQRHLANRRRPDTFPVPYGITTPEDCSVDDLRAFHLVGAEQVKNMPEHLETLIVPAGSCNSLTSVLYGLHLYGHKNLKRLVSIGIGPNKVGWAHNRLKRMGVGDLKFEWNTRVSLHDSGFASYSDSMPETLDGIQFHPTYEGKMIRWMRMNEALQPGIGFWIVGGPVSEDIVKPFY
jgi:1-aminocyclopropane-1-carboxylate deaminase/D-cysteine desulfhydrase-like pyridoxal-dependent ACC family enzyme